MCAGTKEKVKVFEILNTLILSWKGKYELRTFFHRIEESKSSELSCPEASKESKSWCCLSGVTSGQSSRGT